MILITAKEWNIKETDLLAIQYSLALKANGIFNSIIGISIGNPHSLKHAMSFGLDQGILLDATGTPFEHSTIILPHTKDADIIFVSNNKGPFGSLPHILAGMLNWPCKPYDALKEIRPKHILTLPSEPCSLYPSITSILNQNAISYYPITNNPTIPLRIKYERPKRQYQSAHSFIQALIHDGILQ